MWFLPSHLLPVALDGNHSGSKGRRMASASSVSPGPSDRTFFIFNAVVSAGALSLLSWLLLFHGGMTGSTVDLKFMPGVNAVLNGTAAVLLIAGRLAIHRKRADLHRYLMVSAFAASALFLVGYLAYHYVHGDTKFGGTGAVKTIYLAILLSHVMLSITIVPMCLAAFWFAWKREFPRHTKVTRWLHPIWLYVSVTGVVVFLMLRPYY
jgi:putative membrane protein